jgi:hypothetical protein
MKAETALSQPYFCRISCIVLAAVVLLEGVGNDIAGSSLSREVEKLGEARSSQDLGFGSEYLDR